VYGTSKKSVPEMGGSTPNLMEDSANQVSGKTVAVAIKQTVSCF
jgi:hypothetical protein